MSDEVDMGVEQTNDGQTQAAPGPEKAFAFAEVFKTEEKKKAFIGYMQDELRNAIANQGREEFIDNFKKLDKHIRVQPQTATKNWPWKGAANLCPPVTFSRGNTIYSKTLANYSTKRPFWSCEAADSAWAAHAEALADYLNKLSKSPFHLNLKKINRRCFWTTVFKGTQFFEVAWEMKKAPIVEEGKETGNVRYAKNTPVIDLIRIEDFLTRVDWDDIQEMPWCGRKIRYAWAELKAMVSLGIVVKDLALAELKKAEAWTELEQAERELALLDADIASAYEEGTYFELVKFWAYYDVDDSGEVVDVMGIMDVESGQLVRCEINPLSRRLIGKIPYYEVPGFLYGLGVPHILEYLQDEQESLHNATMDAISWAMLQQWKVRSNTPAALDSENMPGKKWPVDNMDDLEPMVTPDLSRAAYPMMEVVDRYADQATGANEAMAGRADPTLKSGGGAEAQMILMQTGSSVLNVSFDTMDEYYSEIGPMLVLILQQNKTLLDPVAFVGEEKGALVREVLALPAEEIPSFFKFSIETTDLARNEGARREEYLGFSALYTSYQQEFTQLYAAYVAAQGQRNQMLMQFYARCLTGKAALMERVVEFFHVGDPKDYVVSARELKTMLEGGGLAPAAGGETNGGQLGADVAGLGPVGLGQAGGPSGMAAGGADAGGAPLGLEEASGAGAL
jgi:hypothetical protein